MAALRDNASSGEPNLPSSLAHRQREIIDVEQHGEERALYGEELMDRLVERLTARYGKGFGPRTLRRIRLFYLTFPIGWRGRIC